MIYLVYMGCYGSTSVTRQKLINVTCQGISN